MGWQWSIIVNVRLQPGEFFRNVMVPRGNSKRRLPRAPTRCRFTEQENVYREGFREHAARITADPEQPRHLLAARLRIERTPR